MYQNKQNLSAQAYNQIKDGICSGKIVPGDILSESRLSQELGMSRTPVREALRSLSSEGLVEIRNGIGAYVKPLSTKDIEDLYEVRCLLELQACKTSIYRIPDEMIQNMEGRFQAVMDYCLQGNILDKGVFSDLDWELHQMLVQYCTNSYIKTIIAGNHFNLRRYQTMAFESSMDAQHSIRQHLDILSYLKKRDLPALLQTLEQHLTRSSKILVEPTPITPTFS